MPDGQTILVRGLHDGLMALAVGQTAIARAGVMRIGRYCHMLAKERLKPRRGLASRSADCATLFSVAAIKLRLSNVSPFPG